jgi:hypothetical protein
LHNVVLHDISGYHVIVSVVVVVVVVVCVRVIAVVLVISVMVGVLIHVLEWNRRRLDHGTNAAWLPPTVTTDTPRVYPNRLGSLDSL